MTEREAELLGLLLTEEPGSHLGVPPRALGGTDASHHSITLRRMVAKGWVERRYRGGEWGAPVLVGTASGSCLYRITPKGAQAWANNKAMQELRNA